MEIHPTGVSMRYRIAALVFLLAAILGCAALAAAAPGESDQDLDTRVRAFLEKHRRQWRDMNVPESDGRILYDLIVENNYTKALEIGTSTGHSGIWIAWALSKTGGKLITVEINQHRYREALENFEAAGLSEYIDARLADAHELVPQLEGPFDFVFCDADKHWYKNYFMAVESKIEVNGCFAAHNVSGRRMRGIGEFLTYVESRPNFETTIERSSWSGISISYKRAEK
jgi:predicted O-methyltransferase YrrM